MGRGKGDVAHHVSKAPLGPQIRVCARLDSLEVCPRQLVGDPLQKVKVGSGCPTCPRQTRFLKTFQQEDVLIECHLHAKVFQLQRRSPCNFNTSCQGTASKAGKA